MCMVNITELQLGIGTQILMNSYSVCQPHISLHNQIVDAYVRWYSFSLDHPRSVILNLFHCWDPLNATDVVWDPQVKIEKVCAPE